LVSDGLIRRHHAAGQRTGPGYPRSMPVLFRELNRQVDWIFSNHAGRIMQCLRALQRPGG
jgi:hypothetical protein